MKKLRSYVEGRWIEGGGEGEPLVNPTTDAVLASTSTQGVDMGAALEYARDRGGPALRALSVAERARRIGAVASAIHEHRDELLQIAIDNGGNTRGDAKFDVDGGTGTLSYYAKLGESLGDRPYLTDGDLVQPFRNPRFVGQHLRVPRPGVAVHINAFNFPAWGLCEKLAPALLGGMPVVTKPAPATALLAERIAEIIAASEILPPGAFSFLAGPPGDLIDHLDHRDVLAFTGSSETGSLIRAHRPVVEHNVHVNVEADSLNAAVLGPDVDPDSDTYDLFLREVAREITQKAGQKCTATRRILVPADLLDAVRRDLPERLAEVKVGNPNLREVRMGPLTNLAQLVRARAGLDELRESAELVYGDGGRGELIDVEGRSGCFMAPVLLQAAPDAGPDSAVHGIEVFAPVSTLVPYDGQPDRAAEIAGWGRGSLVSSLYTDDRDFAREVILGLAACSGRVHVGSARVAEHSPGPGTVLPSLVHGGPGRAGGGEELGGLRGVELYTQRVAVAGAKPLIVKTLLS